MASISSAVKIEYHADDLLKYEDFLSLEEDQDNAVDNSEPQSLLIQPTLPASHISHNKTTLTTHWPDFSQNASALYQMLEEQAKYPPILIARFRGRHTVSVGDERSSSHHTVTDFDIKLDMTHLLVPCLDTPKYLRPRGLQHRSIGTRVYQGQRTKRQVSKDIESGINAVGAAVQAYISSEFPVRSFTLQRQILHQDATLLKGLLTCLVKSTDHQGRTEISFPITHNYIRVYSPCWQNKVRSKIWLRWLAYLFFLWIFTWPYLWFVTRRWDVLVSQFPYGSSLENKQRKYMVKGEEAFFKEWKDSLKRAILEKKFGWIDADYRLATEEVLRQKGPDGIRKIPNTGWGGYDSY